MDSIPLARLANAVPKWDTGEDVIKMPNGAVLVHSLYDADRVTWALEFADCTPTERATLRAFYDAHRNVQWQFDHPMGGAYALTFMPPAWVEEPVKGSIYTTVKINGYGVAL